MAQKARIPEKIQPKKQPDDKKAIDKADTSPYSGFKETPPARNPDEQKIVSALQTGERLVDDVIAETGLPAARVLATLTLLEVRGVVQRLPGKRVRLP